MQQVVQRLSKTKRGYLMLPELFDADLKIRQFPSRFRDHQRNPPGIPRGMSRREGVTLTATQASAKFASSGFSTPRRERQSGKVFLKHSETLGGSSRYRRRFRIETGT